MMHQRPTVELTPREREVLLALCAGHTAKQIGRDLGIRPHTVEAYIDHMRLKLGATNRCHLVALAADQGFCTGAAAAVH